MKVIQRGEISTDSFRSGHFQLLTATDTMKLNLHPRSIPVLTGEPQLRMNKSITNNPSTVISRTLSALQKHCQKNNISYTSVVNVNQLRCKINDTPAGETQHPKNENYSHSQYINTLKSSISCNQNEEVLKFRFRNKYNHNESTKCYLYYPIHFHALRNGLYGNECNFEMQFIESLSKCTPCHVTGGKKGTFCKTDDDKYLLKYIKQNEFKMFLDNFSSYFSYMTDIFQQNLHSLLVPIIGCYAIHSSESKSIQYVLVMPNLFQSRSKLKKFDLKGTLNPKRYSKDEREDNVRLDKNFIEYTKGSPLTLNEESIAYLSDAIENDTKFLCESNIMDYSLLVGINEENNEIIGGIIDYIETFSVKKKAEVSFKSLFMTDPTIQEPSVYKKRFQNSVTNKYFISVKA